MNKNKTNITTEKAADAAAMSDRHRSPFEEWSTAGIGNAFLFGKVMTANPDLLLELLQYSLPEFRIQKINDVQKEVDVKLSIDSHGVQLDILTSDDRGRQLRSRFFCRSRPETGAHCQTECKMEKRIYGLGNDTPP